MTAPYKVDMVTESVISHMAARIAALEAENAELKRVTFAPRGLAQMNALEAARDTLRQQLETAREALVAARHMIYYEDAPLGWNITRLDEALAAIGEAQPTITFEQICDGIANAFKDWPHNDYWPPRITELIRQIGPTPTAQPASAEVELVDEKPFANWLLGDWFKAKTIDDMEAFYWSRLPAIREAARGRGYAIGLHGSMRRDFDLMAMPWREDASDIDVLAHAIANAACGITRDGPYQWEEKPLGRMAVSIPICWTDHSNQDFKGLLSVGHIDLSVIPAKQPRQESEITAAALEEVAREAQRNGNDILAMQLFGKAAQKREAGK